jgi:hypothetical protein
LGEKIQALCMVFTLGEIWTLLMGFFFQKHLMFCSLGSSWNLAFCGPKNVLPRLQNIKCFWKKNPINRVQISPRVKTMHNAWSIKIINFIKDWWLQIKFICFIDYDTYMSWSVPMIFDEFKLWYFFIEYFSLQTSAKIIHR